VFATATQRKLHYGTLAAADATGSPLAAHFDAARADRLRIVVDDAARGRIRS
jgi:hypothetical protein